MDGQDADRKPGASVTIRVYDLVTLLCATEAWVRVLADLPQASLPKRYQQVLVHADATVADLCARLGITRDALLQEEPEDLA